MTVTRRRRPHTTTTRMTLHERVRLARHNLLLIQAASEGAGAVDPDEILQAIYTAAADGLELLTPLAQAPTAIADWQADDTGGTR